MTEFLLLALVLIVTFAIIAWINWSQANAPRLFAQTMRICRLVAVWGLPFIVALALLGLLRLIGVWK